MTAGSPLLGSVVASAELTGIWLMFPTFLVPAGAADVGLAAGALPDEALLGDAPLDFWAAEDVPLATVADELPLGTSPRKRSTTVAAPAASTSARERSEPAGPTA